MRILVVTYNFPPQIGGIEQYCVELCRALQRSGARVHVLAKQAELAASNAFDRGEPYDVQRYRYADVGLIRGIEQQLRGGIDHAICMQWTSATWIAARHAWTHRPRRLAIIAHGKELDGPPGPVPERLRRAALPRVLASADQVWAVSTFTAARVRERARHANVEVLRPGVDPERFAPAERTAVEAWRATRPGPFLLTTGRLIARKGIDTVLRALPRIARKHGRVHYWIAGDGPDRPRLEQLARELGVLEHVEFLGRVADAQMSALYSAADLFALLSRPESGGADVEGFGLVLLEAQACGTPVATTRAGGMPDALVEGATGLLVDAHDPNDFAARASALFSDPARQAAMSNAALRHARTQRWQDTATHALDLLNMRRERFGSR